ncbi:MAG: hypothetical protein AAFX94_25680, partial [Myxococcota bacterium]
ETGGGSTPDPGGGPTPEPGGPPPAECMDSNDCEDWQTCQSGDCVRRPCGDDTECPGDAFCELAGCRAGPRTACDQFSCSQLPLRPICLNLSLCVALECLADLSCPGTEHCTGSGECTTEEDRGGFIGEQCDNDDDCNDGLRCEPSSVSVGACTRNCNTDDDCSDASYCATNFCLPRGTGNWGAECDGAVDCVSGICVIVNSSQSVCSFECTDGRCPEGYQCATSSGGEELCFVSN